MNASENTASKGPIKAVLFDLGDTLVSFDGIRPREIFAAGARASYDYLRSLGQPVGGFKRYSLRSLVSLRLCRWLSTLRRRDFDSLALLKKVGTERGIKLTDNQWEHLTWLWYEPLIRIGRTEPKVKEALAALKNSGLKLGILSNTFVHCSALEKHLEQLGILDFFDVRLYSYQFPFRKPDARIFKVAAERIGHAPQNIVYVGDRIDKDIKPAIRAGMIAVLKDARTNSGKKLPPAAKRIAQVSDLPNMIREINIRPDSQDEEFSVN